MRTIILWIAGAVVVIVLGAAAYITFFRTETGEPTETQTVQVGEEAEPGATKTACDIFTREIAVEILGASAQKAELPDGSTASTEDIVVSNCLYDNGNEDPSALVIANVLVRAAKNTESYRTNEVGFNGTRDQGLEGETVESESIEGLGDAAYYNPAFQQVNVLVNGGQYWILVQVDENERANGETLARAVVANL